MNRNYIFLTILMLALAVGVLFLKNNDELKQIEPQELLKEIIQPTRYVTCDQVAKMIIQKDPSLELIDVRPIDEYSKYSLPGSINIPFDSLLVDGNLDYLGIPGTKVIFISTDDIKADQAWVISKRLGYSNAYVMVGGLNQWVETIINPVEPSEDDPYSAFETYQFRKGAQLYFTGNSAVNNESQKTKVEVTRRKKTTVVAGGC